MPLSWLLSRKNFNLIFKSVQNIKGMPGKIKNKTSSEARFRKLKYVTFEQLIEGPHIGYVMY